MNTKNYKVALFLFFVFVPGLSFVFSQGATVGERVNLGLYGGAAYDLTYCPTNNRLFAAIETPASLFFTDDTCKTWYRAFPTDSLEWSSGSRGWGGGATYILANSKGWVAAQTNQQGGTLTAAVISFSNGDTLTWKTVLDNYLLQRLVGPTVYGNSAMALSDHWLYMTMGKYLARYNDTTAFSTRMIIANADTMAGAISNPDMKSIAVANSATGYPVYVSYGDRNQPYGNLYRYDAGGFTKLGTPTGKMVQRIFTHPAQITGDTVIISCTDTTTQVLSVYITKDRGTTWTDITPLHMTVFHLANADYSPSWVSQMPSSNGLRINLPGTAFSDDLGVSWKYFGLVNNGNATHPTDTSVVIGSRGKGVVVSKHGINGPFVDVINYGLSAAKAGKISTTKGIYYLSTNAGLAYTSAYFNTSIAPYDKWNPPYGEFPLPHVGDDSGISTVAVNPADSLHVIAGYAHGFSVSRTGPHGFVYVNPTTWHSTVQKNQSVTDIKFVNSNIVLAATGSGMNVAENGVVTGNIWRSADGGSSWTLVTPTGLQQPQCLAVGKNSADTVIYCGTGFASGGAPNVDGELWKSTDTGLTWTKVNDGPNSIVGTDSLMPIYDIAVDPRGTDTIYIASGKNLGHAFVKSTNGGATYFYTTVTGEGAFTAVLVDKQHNDTVYAAIRREIHIYNSKYDTHALVNRGMPGEFVPDLENGSLLAATNTGFYKITVPQNLLNGLGPIDDNTQNPADVFPNPADDYLNIRINKSFSHSSYSIYDITGKQLIRNTPVSSKTALSLKSIPPGTYFVRIKIDNDEITRKFVRK